LGGLGKTVTYFKLPDVNLLFTSPVKPTNVIVYAMIKNIGSLIFVVLILVYQTGTMVNALHMTVNDILFTYVGFFILLTMALTTAMYLMLSTSGNEKRKELYKRIFFVFLIALLVYAIFEFYNNSVNTPYDTIKLIISNSMLDFIPIFGWMRGFVVALITSDYNRAMLFGSMSLLLIVVEMILISQTKNDYYEDVLDGATLLSQKIQSAKEGKMVFKLAFKEKKIKHAGIGKGVGASVLMYKRLVERKRGAFGFFSIQNIILIVLGIIFSAIANEMFIPFVIAAIIINIIFQNIGSWENELSKQYIFLIPEEPFKKLTYAILPELIGSLINSGIILVMGIFLFQMNPIIPIIAVVCFISTAFVVSASTIIIRRIFNADSKNTLVKVVAIYLPMILIGVGIIPAAIAQMAVNANSMFPATGSIVLTLWNLGISILLVFLGKGVLTRGMNN